MSKLILAFSVLTTLTSIAQAQDEKLTIGFFSKKEIRRMLGDYPAVGSEGEAADFEALLDYQHTRSQEECDLAAAEKTPTLKTMFASEHGPLTKKEARRLAPRFWKAYIEAGLNIHIAKKAFKRPRPFVSNSDIKPCIPLATSDAYPSGHTAIARVFARLLSDIYPERAEAFMERADQVALNRVIGGVHHPSDIVAGKKLGDAIYHMMREQKLMGIQTLD